MNRKSPTFRLPPILIGLVIGSGFPVFFLDWALLAIARKLGSSTATNPATVILVNALLVAAALLILIQRWEKKSLDSVGICRLRPGDFGIGFVAFILLTAIQNLAFSLRGPSGPAAVAPAQTAVVGHIRVPLMLTAITIAAFAEELGARAFPIERIEMITRSTLLAVSVAFALSLVIHVPFWGFRYTLLIAPGEFFLALLYAWQRRLAPCFIAHMLRDTSSLFGAF